MGINLNLKRRIREVLIASTRFAKKPLTRLKLRKRGSFAGCTWFSLVTRPILEKDRFKSILGAPLALAVVSGSVFSAISQTQAAVQPWVVGQPLPEEIMAVNLVVPSTETQSTYALPVPEVLGISQGFHLGHAGADLRAPLNSPVVAVRSGVVTQTLNDSVGYGKHVYVQHSPFITSLYAHLKEISVQAGDSVNAGDTLGTVGLTGWSTGPHLHLEIYSEGKAVNPLPLLKPALESLTHSIIIDLATPTASRSPSNNH